MMSPLRPLEERVGQGDKRNEVSGRRRAKTVVAPSVIQIIGVNYLQVVDLGAFFRSMYI